MRLMTKRKFVMSLLAICSLACSPNIQANDVKVILLAGQSNMLGTDSNSSLPASLQSPQSDVLFYSNGVLTTLRPGSGANSYLIDTDTFPIAGDNLHFTAQGFMNLGEAFGAFFKSAVLVPEPGSFALLSMAGLTMIRRRR